MTKNPNTQKFYDLVAAHLGTAGTDSFTPETTFVDDLGADSLDMVEIVMAVEAGFNISLEDDARLERTKTLGEAMRYIEEKL